MKWLGLRVGDVLISKSTRKPCTYVVFAVKGDQMAWYLLEDARFGSTNLTDAEKKTELAGSFHVVRGSEYLT